MNVRQKEQPVRKIVNITFIIGLLLVIISLITGFLNRSMWIYSLNISLVLMIISTFGLGLWFWHSKDTPSTHHLAWISIILGMLLFLIGSIFRSLEGGAEGNPTNIFIVTDYLILAAYAFITAGYYFFMSRAGSIIDEVDKLKIIWGAGIFIILVFDLYIAIQATEIFGKATGGLLVNLYYVTLDLIMVLIGITYLFAFYDGKISRFFKLLFVAILLWSLSDIVFILRGSYTQNTSFVLEWLKILSIFTLLFAQKVYAELFTP